jgi:osmotically-inducible protein OsmY
MNNDEKNITDQRIQTDIIERLTHDPKIDPLKIQLEVKDSKVVLKGNVDTEEEKSRVENIAMSVQGVIGVENHLHIGLGIAHALSSLVAQISVGPKDEQEKKDPE